MNQITIKVDFGLKREKVIESNSYISDSIELIVQRSNNFVFDKYPFYYNKKTSVLCAIIGYISNLEDIKNKYNLIETDDVKIVERMYSLKLLNSIYELDGIFMIILFDEKNQKVYIFQSEYNYGLPIYYTKTKEGIVISTSLKQILTHFKGKREIDIEAVQNFLHYEWIVPNESTLIKGVKKLIPKTCLTIDIESKDLSLLRLKAINMFVSIDKAKKDLLPSIKENIFSLYNNLDNKVLSQSLGSGWDGNLILFYLKEISKNKEIKVITINGGEGKNEVPATRRVLEDYTKINHIITKVGDNIDFLPDIVWRYEGYTFQEGIFLRYVLAKILSKEKCKFVFLGAAADPILYQDHKNINKEIFKSAPNKYMVRIDYHLKMHEIMLNSFDIQGLYPFVNKDVAINSRSLRELNKNKQFYIDCIKRLMKNNITKNLKKSGNVVDTDNIFTRNKEILLKIFESGFVKKILSKEQINHILKEPERNHIIILQVAYIYLFNDLFISGRYDSEFGKASIDIKLKEFLCGFDKDE